MDSSSTSVLREGSDTEREKLRVKNKRRLGSSVKTSERLAAETQQQREARLERVSTLS